MKALLALLLVASVAHANNKVIYGEDNRQDVFEVTNQMQLTLARSTAAMIPSSSLQRTGDEVRVMGPTMESRGFCREERFSQQPTAANCSGFLVGDKYLVTAGHCITSMSDCTGYRWVFDYKVDYSTQSQVTVPANSVYACKRIISRALEQASGDDYALIELERSVNDRAPLAFRRQGQISVGEEILVIGHPTGLPTKITDQARVRSARPKYFVTNLDTYGGNSGSAVFNARTGVVEGILVRGENDYVYDSARSCRASNICPENGCRGEDVTFITNIKELANL